MQEEGELKVKNIEVDPAMHTDPEYVKSQQMWQDPELEGQQSPEKRHHKLKKSIRPNEDLIRRMKLKYGKNTIKYEVIGEGMKEDASTFADVYLFKSTTKLVISDIDGTITKSDVLGHIMPLMGRDWTHEGITELYSSIQSSGYQMMYLTARAIGQV